MTKVISDFWHKIICTRSGVISPNIIAAVGDAGDDEQSIGGASDAMCDTYEMYRDDIRRRHRV
jgi:hypothetical protein